jgi:hypothetical protein
MKNNDLKNLQESYDNVNEMFAGGFRQSPEDPEGEEKIDPAIKSMQPMQAVLQTPILLDALASVFESPVGRQFKMALMKQIQELKRTSDSPAGKMISPQAALQRIGPILSDLADVIGDGKNIAARMFRQELAKTKEGEP